MGGLKTSLSRGHDPTARAAGDPTTRHNGRSMTSGSDTQPSMTSGSDGRSRTSGSDSVIRGCFLFGLVPLCAEFRRDRAAARLFYSAQWAAGRWRVGGKSYPPKGDAPGFFERSEEWADVMRETSLYYGIRQDFLSENSMSPTPMTPYSPTPQNPHKFRELWVENQNLDFSPQKLSSDNENSLLLLPPRIVGASAQSSPTSPSTHRRRSC